MLRAIRICLAVLLGVTLLPIVADAVSVKTGALLVFVADSASHKPVRGVGVTVRRPCWYVSDTHHEPDWFGATDSTGRARMRKIPVGSYEATLCENTYDPRTVSVEIVQHRVDTLRVKMVYLGPPSDGRRCEVRFEIPKSMLRRIKTRRP